MPLKSKSFRGLFLSCGCAFVLAAACGSNPELANNGDPFRGRAGLGEECGGNSDCGEALVCGSGDRCVGACGDVAGSGCGDEACLVNGRCSQGLGRACADESDCNAGLLCSERKHCSAPCEPGAEKACKNGAACYDDGTCPTDRDLVIGGIGGASGDGTGGDGAGGSSSCIDVGVAFTPQVPTVLLLIDRSGSMNADGFGNAVKEAVGAGTYTLGDCPKDNDWRWNVVRDVLMNPTKGIVKPLEDRVRFGLSLYSSNNGRVKAGAPDEIDDAKACPVLLEQPILLNNHQPMLDAFKCNDIADDTPTGESLQAAAETLRAFAEPGPKLIVLATDGEPDNCECPDFGDGMPEKCKAAGLPAQIKAEVVAIAKAINGDDITVHVINVSTPSNAALQKHLTDVAEAGGGNIYPGFSPGALSSAFDDIINGARPCKIDLAGTIAKGEEATGTVTLDGGKLVLDDDDGWQVNTASQIELLGEACETIKSGEHGLSIKFPCEAFEPVVH